MAGRTVENLTQDVRAPLLHQTRPVRHHYWQEDENEDEEEDRERESVCARCGPRTLEKLGLRSTEEAVKVAHYALQQFLANSVFVIARNVGTVLFMKCTVLGAPFLTSAIVTSGVLTFLLSSVYSKLSAGRPATTMNRYVLQVSTLLMGLLYLGTLAIPQADPPTSLLAVLSGFLFFSIFLAEDMISMYIMLQSATVYQQAFTITEGKRLFGLIQMGSSIAAMVVGISIGSIASAIGTEPLLAIQVVMSAASLFLNEKIVRSYEPMEKCRKKKAGGKARAGADPWWKSPLLLAMGLWAFTVVAVKTIFEYQYNVLVAGTMTSDQMVTLTGYLYAVAGVLSSAVNLVGSKKVMDRFGIQVAILIVPASLLAVSTFILASLSVTAAFAGRVVDLTLRWSINNTARSILWNAVPEAQQVAAKPWIEGTMKKLGAAINAALITVTLLISGNQLSSLSILSLLLTGVLFAGCVRLHKYYRDSMFLRIKRREGKSFGSELANLDYHELLKGGDRSGRRLIDPLNQGNTRDQLWVLKEMGESLSESDWRPFFAQFYHLSTSVQVEILELNRTQRSRVPDKFLLGLLYSSRVKPAVTTAAILAAGDRQLDQAVTILEVHLSSKDPEVRAAAAASILKIGWGPGLGHATTVALHVLQAMLRLPETSREKQQRRLLIRALAEAPSPTSPDQIQRMETRAWRMGKTRSFRRGRSTLEENICASSWSLLDCVRNTKNLEGVHIDLEELSRRLQEDWEQAIQKGNTSQAVLFAVQRTFVESERRAEAQLAQGADSAGLAKIQMLPPAEDFRARSDETAVALRMLRELPEPPRHPGGVDSALRGGLELSDQAWLQLLQHPSPKVQVQAMTFVTDQDFVSEFFEEEVAALIRCLCEQETYNAAEQALQRLKQPQAVRTELMTQFCEAVEDYKLQMQEALAAAHPTLEVPVTPREGLSRHHPAPETRMQSLLKFLDRQCQSEAASQEDLKALFGDDLCSQLLQLSGELADSDQSQQILAALLDLRANGFGVCQQKATERLNKVATGIFHGLAVQRWVKRLKDFRVSESAVLRLHQYLMELPGSEGPSTIEPKQHQEGREESKDSSGSAAARETLTLVLDTAIRFIEEHLYLQRLQLLQLTVLAFAKSAHESEDEITSRSVLAMWRVLRSDARQEAAALEVLDTMLPFAVKAKVLLLLDSSPLERKLSEGVKFCAELAAEQDPSVAPSWMMNWFMLPVERLGVELGVVCRFLTEVGGGGGLRGGQPWLPPPGGPDALLPKLLLLCSPAVRLYSELLVIHIAELGMVAEVVPVSFGEQLCKSRETYIVVQGSFKAQNEDDVFSRGTVIQELHAVCEELEPMDVTCVSPTGGTVLRVRDKDLFDLMIRLPPKFALNLLQSLLQMLPPPSQDGGRSEEHSEVQEKAAATESQGVRSVKFDREVVVDLEAGDSGLPHQVPEHFGVFASAESHEQQDSEQLGDQQSAKGERTVSEEEELASLARQWERDCDNAKGTQSAVGAVVEGGCEAYSESVSQGVEARAQDNPISLHERLIVLRGAKIFRHLQTEFLAAVAGVCGVFFYKNGDVLFQQGQPTGATLYIVAEGAVGLYRGGVFQRQLAVSDSLGNTGLLFDHEWTYSAAATEDTWLLLLERDGLTDLLRGRRELASAVIRGLYKTLTRRMKRSQDKDAMWNTTIHTKKRKELR